ncbi:hypothetical protein K437DRAFT_16549 [Tilletiaria anomala UBC 951]|uniref:Uncharacterized protein n=1 Tax=Tilletiaria anomala (strain ATCC 24038 / CBS 436.72 / UBC 951) TaxID=1037660 RepID=A0A066WP35_TILAU|nr:uncharacterized protein K437DRAFT_16549 [Tilletiaria anomala UBC 951]KDN52345.1 hypothetical protein K437DRAFT_16549 [Tilletiaria anomala UBC 951]
MSDGRYVLIATAAAAAACQCHPSTCSTIQKRCIRQPYFYFLTPAVFDLRARPLFSSSSLTGIGHPCLFLFSPLRSRTSVLYRATSPKGHGSPLPFFI